MKLAKKLALVAMMAMMGVVAVAQDRVYERTESTGYDFYYSKYVWTESNGELGYRFYSQGTSQSPCLKGFHPLIKSNEAGATIYTTQKTLRFCENFRFVFPNGDLSSGYKQDKLPTGEFMPIAIQLDEWRKAGMKPIYILKL